MNPHDTIPTLDLTKVHFTHALHDLMIHGTWMHDEGQYRPCLVIVPRYKEIDRAKGMKPCVVPLATAYLWSDTIGDPKHCAHTSWAFAGHLGMEQNKFNCSRIMTMVQDHLQDLIEIPVRPTEVRVVADVIRTDASGKQHHDEVLSRV